MLFLLVELYTIEHITSMIYLACIVILTTTATVLRRNGLVKQQKLRCRQDSNLRGKIPMDF